MPEAPGAPFDAFDPATRLGVRLEPAPPRLRTGQRVHWTFAVTNRGRDQRRLVFASAQQGEVVLEADDSELYRWSRGRLFAAVIAEQKLRAGEEWGFALEDVLSVEPGTYALLATVTAQPALPVVRGEVSIFL